jgi:hypothetical protein
MYKEIIKGDNEKKKHRNNIKGGDLKTQKIEPKNGSTFFIAYI